MKMWTGQKEANFDNRDARDREERARRRERERAVRVEERRKTKRKAKKSKTGSSTPDIDLDIINSLKQPNCPLHPNRMLMRICQENGYKPEYLDEKRQEEWRSKVIVNDSQVFFGQFCKNKKEAKRSASEAALRQLV